MKEIKHTSANSLQEVLDSIGATAYKEYQKASNSNERAFLIGIMHTLAALDHRTEGGTIVMRYDYDEVKRAFDKADRLTNLPEDIAPGQISMEEIKPGILSDNEKELKSEINKAIAHIIVTKLLQKLDNEEDEH